MLGAMNRAYLHIASSRAKRRKRKQMKPILYASLLWLAVALGLRADAQTYDTNNVVVQTFAGSDFYGYVDGQGTQTMFNGPLFIVADSGGNLLVLDENNDRIRKITPGGAVSTLAGGGYSPWPGYGTNVSLGAIYYDSMIIDPSNVLWIMADSTLLRIGGNGYVSGTNIAGITSGLRSHGLCLDSQHNFYISDGDALIYRYRTNGALEVFAGSGNNGSQDGNGIFTSFDGPAALAADAADNIYVWDDGNHLIRRINQNRDVVTIAGKKGGSDSDGLGTNTAFSSISAMWVDGSGSVIIACGSSIRKITASTNVLTLAGSFTQTGYTNGAGSLARFRNATGVFGTQGMIFVADHGDARIRNITFNAAPQPVSYANLELNTYPGLRITGVVGRTYQIQSSTNMSTWKLETTVLLTSSPYLWIDPNPLGQKKFYRAFLLP
jgi:hypothetical protein